MAKKQRGLSQAQRYRIDGPRGLYNRQRPINRKGESPGAALGGRRRRTR